LLGGFDLEFGGIFRWSLRATTKKGRKPSTFWAKKVHPSDKILATPMRSIQVRRVDRAVRHRGVCGMRRGWPVHVFSRLRTLIRSQQCCRECQPPATGLCCPG